MRILLTGCAGFIGWKVSELLLGEGGEVLGIDNVNDAYDARLKRWRLGRLEGRRGFEFYPRDICDRAGLRELAEKKLGAEAVINLAARAGVRQSMENPWVYLETNVTGTLNLLEFCRELGIKKFVLASSSSVYGAGASRPSREESDTDTPLSPYAASKKAAEALCHAYYYAHGIDVSVLRYFTVYGPAGRPDMSPFRFVQWIAEGVPVRLYGDGTQSRDFTYVDDIARGTVAALKPVGYEAINLGSDQPVVLNDAIRIIEELVGARARIEMRPRHPADVPTTWADIGKAERLLGWRPTTKFKDGMASLVAWYRANREWARAVKTAE